MASEVEDWANPTQQKQTTASKGRQKLMQMTTSFADFLKTPSSNNLSGDAESSKEAHVQASSEGKTAGQQPVAKTPNRGFSFRFSQTPAGGTAAASNNASSFERPESVSRHRGGDPLGSLDYTEEEALASKAPEHEGDYPTRGRAKTKKKKPSRNRSHTGSQPPPTTTADDAQSGRGNAVPKGPKSPSGLVPSQFGFVQASKQSSNDEQQQENQASLSPPRTLPPMASQAPSPTLTSTSSFSTKQSSGLSPKRSMNKLKTESFFGGDSQTGNRLLKPQQGSQTTSTDSTAVPESGESPKGALPKVTVNPRQSSPSGGFHFGFFSDQHAEMTTTTTANTQSTHAPSPPQDSPEPPGNSQVQLSLKKTKSGKGKSFDNLTPTNKIKKQTLFNRHFDPEGENTDSLAQAPRNAHSVELNASQSQKKQGHSSSLDTGADENDGGFQVSPTVSPSGAFRFARGHSTGNSEVPVESIADTNTLQSIDLEQLEQTPGPQTRDEDDGKPHPSQKQVGSKAGMMVDFSSPSSGDQKEFLFRKHMGDNDSQEAESKQHSQWAMLSSHSGTRTSQGTATISDTNAVATEVLPLGGTPGSFRLKATHSSHPTSGDTPTSSAGQDGSGDTQTKPTAVDEHHSDFSKGFRVPKSSPTQSEKKEFLFERHLPKNEDHPLEQEAKDAYKQRGKQQHSTPSEEQSKEFTPLQSDSPSSRVSKLKEKNHEEEAILESNIEDSSNAPQNTSTRITEEDEDDSDHLEEMDDLNKFLGKPVSAREDSQNQTRKETWRHSDDDRQNHTTLSMAVGQDEESSDIQDSVKEIPSDYAQYQIPPAALGSSNVPEENSSRVASYMHTSSSGQSSAAKKEGEIQTVPDDDYSGRVTPDVNVASKQRVSIDKGRKSAAESARSQSSYGDQTGKGEQPEVVYGDVYSHADSGRESIQPDHSMGSSSVKKGKASIDRPSGSPEVANIAGTNDVGSRDKYQRQRYEESDQTGNGMELPTVYGDRESDTDARTSAGDGRRRSIQPEQSTGSSGDGKGKESGIDRNNGSFQVANSAETNDMSSTDRYQRRRYEESDQTASGMELPTVYADRGSNNDARRDDQTHRKEQLYEEEATGRNEGSDVHESLRKSRKPKSRSKQPKQSDRRRTSYGDQTGKGAVPEVFAHDYAQCSRASDSARNEENQEKYLPNEASSLEGESARERVASDFFDSHRDSRDEVQFHRSQKGASRNMHVPQRTRANEQWVEDASAVDIPELQESSHPTVSTTSKRERKQPSSFWKHKGRGSQYNTKKVAPVDPGDSPREFSENESARSRDTHAFTANHKRSSLAHLDLENSQYDQEQVYATSGDHRPRRRSTNGREEYSAAPSLAYSSLEETSGSNTGAGHNVEASSPQDDGYHVSSHESPRTAQHQAAESTLTKSSARSPAGSKRQYQPSRKGFFGDTYPAGQRFTEQSAAASPNGSGSEEANDKAQAMAVSSARGSRTQLPDDGTSASGSATTSTFRRHPVSQYSHNFTPVLFNTAENCIEGVAQMGIMDPIPEGKHLMVRVPSGKGFVELIESQTLRRCVLKGWLKYRSPNGMTAFFKGWTSRFCRLILNTRIERVPAYNGLGFSLDEKVDSAWLLFLRKARKR
eukprot:gb/GECG01001705.1/.p1 GENE.gb/GECG01001705.1/~~gb/GECG01001705.1/.p1  ORF type:complete len:1618 (+),score=280.23 gb/GECG01001705.1/:1-4854(+)